MSIKLFTKRKIKVQTLKSKIILYSVAFCCWKKKPGQWIEVTICITLYIYIYLHIDLFMNRKLWFYDNTVCKFKLTFLHFNALNKWPNPRKKTPMLKHLRGETVWSPNILHANPMYYLVAWVVESSLTIYVYLQWSTVISYVWKNSFVCWLVSAISHY